MSVSGPAFREPDSTFIDTVNMTLQTQILFGLFLVSLLITYGNVNWNQPLVAIFNRWMRWIVTSALVASMAIDFSLTGRPYWLIFVTAFLGWFLLETAYNWAIISALSRSPIPLFPRFQKNSGGDEWPATKHFILLRDWLRTQGFHKLDSIKASLDDTVAIRSSIYQNKEKTMRCQIMFFPARSTRMSVSYVISTMTQEGELVITDNVYLPFGGYYPDNWFIERKPLCRSLCRLIKYHKRRLQREAVNVAPWDDDDPMEELNRQQRTLEQINLQYGFLNLPEHQEEHGRITGEGRYRLWKEIWLLNYFGSTVAYR